MCLAPIFKQQQQQQSTINNQPTKKPTNQKTNQISRTQVKVTLSHHSIADGPKITAEKPLVFVLDPLKDMDAPEAEGKKRKKKSKKGKAEPTAKNFGARLSVDKMKSSARFIVGWRMRLLGFVWAA